jgi:hypothetical protein
VQSTGNLALPPEGSIDDSHHIHRIWKRPRQKQGFDGVKKACSCGSGSCATVIMQASSLKMDTAEEAVLINNNKAIGEDTSHY